MFFLKLNLKRTASFPSHNSSYKFLNTKLKTIKADKLISIGTSGLIYNDGFWLLYKTVAVIEICVNKIFSCCY